MKVEICTTTNREVGVKNKKNEIVYLKNNTIRKTYSSLWCFETKFSIEGNTLKFKGLSLELPFNNEDLNLLKALYFVLGKSSNEVLEYDSKKARIHIDTQVKLLKLKDNPQINFTRFCGNYGLLLPQYCISNGEFAIYGPRAEQVREAYSSLKDLVDEVGKVLLKLKEEGIE